MELLIWPMAMQQPLPRLSMYCKGMACIILARSSVDSTFTKSSLLVSHPKQEEVFKGAHHFFLNSVIKGLLFIIKQRFYSWWLLFYLSHIVAVARLSKHTSMLFISIPIFMLGNWARMDLICSFAVPNLRVSIVSVA